MRRLLFSAITMMLMPVAAGQDPLAEEPPEIRRYMVEVIIFRYAEEVSIGTEVFMPDMPVLQEFSAEPVEELIFGDPIVEPVPTELPAETESVVRFEEFILHLDDEFVLGDIMSQLERLDVYEPIMHFAWTQETHPEEDTRAIELESLSPAPEYLTGSFKLYLSRYLHLVVDLTLDEVPVISEPVAIDDSVFTFSDARSEYDPWEEDAGVVRFRIQEDRIFKNGDLRYFDHPKFGVLAKITRVEEEELEVEPEMLGDDPLDLPGSIGQ